MVNFRYVITACERSRQESFGCWACCTILLSSEETAARLRAGSLAKSTGPYFHGWLRTCHYRRVLVRDAKLRSDRSQNHRFDLKGKAVYSSARVVWAAFLFYRVGAWSPFVSIHCQAASCSGQSLRCRPCPVAFDVQTGLGLQGCAEQPLGMPCRVNDEPDHFP